MKNSKASKSSIARPAELRRAEFVWKEAQQQFQVAKEKARHSRASLKQAKKAAKQSKKAAKIAKAALVAAESELEKTRVKAAKKARWTAKPAKKMRPKTKAAKPAVRAPAATLAPRKPVKLHPASVKAAPPVPTVRDVNKLAPVEAAIPARQKAPHPFVEVKTPRESERSPASPTPASGTAADAVAPKS